MLGPAQTILFFSLYTLIISISIIAKTMDIATLVGPSELCPPDHYSTSVKIHSFRQHDAPGGHPDFGNQSYCDKKKDHLNQKTVRNSLVNGIPKLLSSQVGGPYFTTLPNFDLWYDRSLLPPSPIYRKFYNFHLCHKKNRPMHYIPKQFFPLDSYDGEFHTKDLETEESHNHFFTVHIELNFIYTERVSRLAYLDLITTDNTWVFLDHILLYGFTGNENFEFIDFQAFSEKHNLTEGKAYTFSIFYAQRCLSNSIFQFEAPIHFISPLYEDCRLGEYFSSEEKKCVKCKSCGRGLQNVSSKVCSGADNKDNSECERIPPLKDDHCGVCHVLVEGEIPHFSWNIVGKPEKLFENPECGETPQTITYYQYDVYAEECPENTRKWPDYDAEYCRHKEEGNIKNCPREFGLCGYCKVGTEDKNTGHWRKVLGSEVTVPAEKCGEYDTIKFKRQLWVTSTDCYSPNLLFLFPDSKNAELCNGEEKGKCKGCIVVSPFNSCATCVSIPKDKAADLPSHQWHESITEHHDPEEVPCAEKFYDEYIRKFHYTAYDCYDLSQVPLEVNDWLCHERVYFEEHACSLGSSRLKFIVGLSVGTLTALLGLIAAIFLLYRYRRDKCHFIKTKKQASFGWQTSTSPTFKPPSLPFKSSLYDEPRSSLPNQLGDLK